MDITDEDRYITAVSALAVPKKHVLGYGVDMFKQKRKKKSLLIFLIIIIALAGGAAYRFLERVPTDPVEVADGFLVNLAEGKGGRALDYVTRSFHQGTDAQKVLRLVGRGSIFKTTRKFYGKINKWNPGRILLTGLLHDRNDATRPIQITMMLENDAWRVDRVEIIDDDQPPAADDSPEKIAFDPKTVPPRDALAQMTMDTLLAFNRSVTGQDFTPLYEHISKTGRSRTSPEELEKAFTSFIEHGVDIAAIGQAKPAFDPAPVIDGGGRLLVKGMYPTKPARVFFNLEYVFEDEEWRLIGIDVQIKR